LKKFLSIVISCIICACMVGCVSDEEKFMKEEQEWLKGLTCDDFKLHFIVDTGEFVEYEFAMLSSDLIVTETITFDFVSDEVQKIMTSAIYKTVLHEGDFLNIIARFGMEFLPKDKVPKNLPFTLHYTTTGEKKVSKDYILDFTQTPFRDYRNR